MSESLLFLFQRRFIGFYDFFEQFAAPAAAEIGCENLFEDLFYMEK